MASSIKEGDLALKIPEGMESEGAPYGFAIMDENNQELLDLFNAGLKNIKENGKYDEIIDKYLKQYKQVPGRTRKTSMVFRVLV